MKKTLTTLFASCLVSSAADAMDRTDRERSPIIWNSVGNEVAVIKGRSWRFGPDFVVIHPTGKFLGLGRYQVVMPVDALRPRAQGGWETSISDDDFPYLPPEVPQYFQPSGT